MTFFKRTMDRLGENARWGYLVALILLLISYGLNYYTNNNLVNESNWVNRTQSIISDLEILNSKLNESESGVRGYFYTGDDAFLASFNKSATIFDSLSKDLRHTTSGNPFQQKRLDTLDAQVKMKVEIFKSSIALFKKSNSSITDSLKNLSNKGRLVMDNVRSTIFSMNREETGLMHERSGQIVSFSHFINVINIASLLIAMIIIGYSLFTFNKENVAKKAADLKTVQYREQLELRVKQLDSLNAEMAELKSIEKFALTGRISRTIAHEVRNPLTNINLAVEQIRVEVEKNEDCIMLLDMISRNGTRINQLISDLLNSTRTNLLNFEKRKVNDLLNESLLFAADRIELKNIRVIKEYCSDECLIEVDTQKINIAFLNIIVNACEAMEPDKGILTLKTEMKNNKCIVTISDNGKGIDAENVNKLFEPYFTTKDSGTGLGLTNTQNIILSHKASIQAESNAGKGTAFIISFSI